MYHVSTQGVDECMMNVHYYHDVIYDDAVYLRRQFEALGTERRHYQQHMISCVCQSSEASRDSPPLVS